MSALAATYHGQERYEEAERSCSLALEARKRVLGQEHPKTLFSMHNLAVTWNQLGRTAEALSLMEACCKLREKVLGAEHPDTKSSFEVLNIWRAESSEGSV